MNKFAKLAAAGSVAVLLGSAAVALADDAAPPKGQVSAAAGKDLQAAQKALQAKSYDEALTDLQKVKDNPKKNDYDDYVMNQFYYSIYASQKKYQEALDSLQAILASKYLTGDELKQRDVNGTFLAYELKNYDKTIEFGTAALKAGATGDQLNSVIADSYYIKNDYPNTDKFVRTMVEDEIKAGQMPTETTLLLGNSAAEKLNDPASEQHWLELLVTYYPKQGYWQNLLQPLYTNKLNDKQLLQVYRLSAAVGAMSSGTEFTDMAQLALAAGSPGEAMSALNAGFAANAFTTDADKNRNQHLLDSAKKAAASDQPTLAKSEADGANAATGDRLVGAGIGYYGYGDYAKAAKDISAGLAKGVAKDSMDARLLLGISQLKSGDKAAAVETFKQVKGDAVTERVAALWILHAKA